MTITKHMLGVHLSSVSRMHTLTHAVSVSSMCSFGMAKQCGLFECIFEAIGVDDDASMYIAHACTPCHFLHSWNLNDNDITSLSRPGDVRERFAVSHQCRVTTRSAHSICNRYFAKVPLASTNLNLRFSDNFESEKQHTSSCHPATAFGAQKESASMALHLFSVV